MNEEKVIQLILENKDNIAKIKEAIDTKMATKDDVDDIKNTLDKLIGFYTKNDQENTMRSHRLNEVSEKVEQHDVDIKKIKPLVGLAA